MKTFSFLLTLLLFASAQNYGQDTQASKAQLEVQTGKSEKKGAELMTTTVPLPKVSGKAEESRVTYGGLLVDLAKAEKPVNVVSLRTPANPNKDSENLSTDPQTGKARGFVLFSIKF
jgi:hypothetical protein